MPSEQSYTDEINDALCAVDEWDEPIARIEAVDGIRCLHCGQLGGAMVPLGWGPRGQVFAHPGCRS